MIDHQAKYEATREEERWLQAYIKREVDALGVRTRHGRKSLIAHALAAPAVQEDGHDVPDIRGVYVSANRQMRREWR